MQKLLVFDSHPVQYRVPIWRMIEHEIPGGIDVAYASDCSVRGHLDREFGKNIAWDDPMLEGYGFKILHAEKGEPLSGPESLTGKGVTETLDEIQPSAVLLTGLNYRFDRIAYREARKRNIPVWLRCETQDEAVKRSFFKSIIRSAVYRFAYRGFSKIFYIGELNRKHYLRHGVDAMKLVAARYCTVDRFAGMSALQKQKLREHARKNAGFAEDALLIGFSGKLIPKKNPGILFETLKFIPADVRSKVGIYLIGSGELESSLKDAAQFAETQYGIKTYFTGFVNQSSLPAHYLAVDILVLPSRRMGETWGLVANEGMQAGCSMIVSDAVGCYADFSNLERFRVFREGDEKGLSEKINELSKFKRSFEWAQHDLKNYTVEVTAQAITQALKKN